MDMLEEESGQTDVDCYPLPGNKEQIMKENKPIIDSLDISVLKLRL